MDDELGLSVIDRFTYYTLEFFERNVTADSNATIADLFYSYNYQKLKSHAGWRTDLFNRPIEEVLLTDFFGSVSRVQLTQSEYPLIEKIHTSTGKSENANENDRNPTFKNATVPSEHLHVEQPPLFSVQFLSTAAVFITLLVTFAKFV